MSTLTNITGYIYDPQGNIVVEGILHIQLQQDMVSVDGTKVAPFDVMVDLSASSGYVDVSVYPTVGASPAGLAYKVEFDSDPLDTSKPIKLKDGYWRNYWAVPNSGSVDIGVFLSALRGEPANNYMPIGGTVSSFSDSVTLGSTASATNKRIRANQDDNTPEIRYNDATSEWQFSNDGTTFAAIGTGGVGSTVGGDLSGTVSSATVIKIRNVAVAATAPTNGQTLKYNSGTAQWEPSSDATSLTNLNASNLTSGTVPLARLSGITNTEISASAAIAWTKISKTGSSLADFATRSASDLNTGTLPLARLSGITNTEISASAGIAATKLADGSVTNAELQNINDLDQHVATTSTPQFARVGFGAAADSSAVAKLAGQYYSPLVDLGSSGSGTVSFNWNSGNDQKVTLTGDPTFIFSNPKDGARYVILEFQDGTGGRTPSYPANVVFQNGLAPTPTSTPSKMDMVVMIYCAATDKYYATFAGNY